MMRRLPPGSIAYDQPSPRERQAWREAADERRCHDELYPRSGDVVALPQDTTVAPVERDDGHTHPDRRSE